MIKRKQMILSVFSLLCLYACENHTKKVENFKTKTIMTDTIPQYPKEKQKSYVLHLNTKTPYELYFDDILINSEDDFGISQSIQLNPYLLQNGTYIVRIRYLPRPNSSLGDNLLQPEDVYYSSDSKWNIYFLELTLNNERPLGYEDTIDYASAALEVIPPPSAVPFWDQEWEVEVKNIPYDLRGWRDGEDLSVWDQEELEKEVLAYYQKVRNMMDQGLVFDFMDITSRKDIELAIATYSTTEEYQDMRLANIANIEKECVGKMRPIDYYEMRLFAHGKLVGLQIPFGEFKDWSVLMSDDDEEGTSSWNILLYRPKDGKDFVPIRK